MASIEKRIDSKGNITYRARVRQAGRKSQFATFPKLNDAKIWAARVEFELHQSKYEEPKNGDLHTVAEMIDRYIEVELAVFAIPSDDKSGISLLVDLRGVSRVGQRFCLRVAGIDRYRCVPRKCRAPGGKGNAAGAGHDHEIPSFFVRFRLPG